MNVINCALEREVGGRVFVHGGSTWAEEVPLDFSDNSNPLGPPPEVEEALRLAAERGVHRRPGQSLTVNMRLQGRIRAGDGRL